MWGLNECEVNNEMHTPHTSKTFSPNNQEKLLFKKMRNQGKGEKLRILGQGKKSESVFDFSELGRMRECSIGNYLHRNGGKEGRRPTNTLPFANSKIQNIHSSLPPKRKGRKNSQPILYGREGKSPVCRAEETFNTYSETQTEERKVKIGDESFKDLLNSSTESEGSYIYQGVLGRDAIKEMEYQKSVKEEESRKQKEQFLTLIQPLLVEGMLKGNRETKNDENMNNNNINNVEEGMDINIESVLCNRSKVSSKSSEKIEDKYRRMSEDRKRNCSSMGEIGKISSRESESLKMASPRDKDTKDTLTDDTSMFSHPLTSALNQYPRPLIFHSQLLFQLQHPKPQNLKRKHSIIRRTTSQYEFYTPKGEIHKISPSMFKTTKEEICRPASVTFHNENSQLINSTRFKPCILKRNLLSVDEKRQKRRDMNTINTIRSINTINNIKSVNNNNNNEEGAYDPGLLLRSECRMGDQGECVVMEEENIESKRGIRGRVKTPSSLNSLILPQKYSGVTYTDSRGMENIHNIGGNIGNIKNRGNKKVVSERKAQISISEFLEQPMWRYEAGNYCRLGAHPPFQTHVNPKLYSNKSYNKGGGLGQHRATSSMTELKLDFPRIDTNTPTSLKSTFTGLESSKAARSLSKDERKNENKMGRGRTDNNNIKYVKNIKNIKNIKYIKNIKNIKNIKSLGSPTSSQTSLKSKLKVNPDLPKRDKVLDEILGQGRLKYMIELEKKGLIKWGTLCSEYYAKNFKPQTLESMKDPLSDRIYLSELYKQKQSKHRLINSGDKLIIRNKRTKVNKAFENDFSKFKAKIKFRPREGQEAGILRIGIYIYIYKQII